MRISDWSSDVCSSDLKLLCRSCAGGGRCRVAVCLHKTVDTRLRRGDRVDHIRRSDAIDLEGVRRDAEAGVEVLGRDNRSEEHTSELQSLMRISYAVFCLKKKTITIHTNIIRYKEPTC